MLKKNYAFVLSLSFCVSIVLAEEEKLQNPQQKGLEIAKEIERRDSGFGDSKSAFKMVLRDQHGNERSRSMRNKTLEVEGDGDKSIIIFDNPGDVKGTAFLSFTHRQGPDDQWLYLPRLRKVKRISSSNKSGAFVNSEFSYEDIASQEVDKYTYKFLRDDTHDGKPVFVNEADPIDPKSGYSKLEIWVDKERYIPLKIDFYNRGGVKKKTLSFAQYKRYLDKFWRAGTWSMVNHMTGKSTILETRDWVFKNGFTEKDFNKNSLSRVK